MGAIPIISDIIEAATSFVGWIWDSIPRFLKFLFFFAIILLIGNLIIPFFLNVSGTFCTSDGSKLKGSTFDIVNNIKWAKSIGMGENDTRPGTILVESECYTTFNTTGVNETFYNGAYCTDCDVIDTRFNSFYRTEGVFNNINYCEADAYHQPNTEKNWAEKIFCEARKTERWYAMKCEPPVDYYWEQDTNLYTCTDLTKCGNVTEASFSMSEMFDDGYILLNAPTERSIVGISCFKTNDGGYKPKLALGASATSPGIDVFDIKFWSIIILILIIIWAYMNLK